MTRNERTQARPVHPIAGRWFRAAVDHPAHIDRRQRKLLAALAAYRDAGIDDPPVAELARRTGIPPDEIDTVLKALIRRKLIFVHWSPYARFGPQRTHGRVRRRRNRYRLLCIGDPDPAHSQPIAPHQPRSDTLT